MNARARFGAGTDARLKKILRLKIAFVGQVVYREIEIDPTSNPFGHAQIENVEARSAHAKVFAVQTIAVDVAISQRTAPPLPSGEGQRRVAGAELSE